MVGQHIPFPNWSQISRNPEYVPPKIEINPANCKVTRTLCFFPLKTKTIGVARSRSMPTSVFEYFQKIYGSVQISRKISS